MDMGWERKRSYGRCQSFGLDPQEGGNLQGQLCAEQGNSQAQSEHVALRGLLHSQVARSSRQVDP